MLKWIKKRNQRKFAIKRFLRKFPEQYYADKVYINRIPLHKFSKKELIILLETILSYYIDESVKPEIKKRLDFIDYMIKMNPLNNIHEDKEPDPNENNQTENQ